MASKQSRLERLLDVIGEKNLPPKLPPKEPTVKKEQNTTAKAPEKSSTDENNWWDAKPIIQQPTTTRSTIPGVTSHNGAYTPDPHKGAPAPLGIKFSPFIAVTKFPYKFVKPELLQPLASAFFDEGKIWNREWDIYYVWSDHAPTAAPVTFIPEHQLLALLAEINEAFPKAKVTISESLRESGLVIDFDEDCEHPDLRPRWAGRTSSKEQYETCVDDVAMTNQFQTTSSTPSDRSLQAFREKIEAAQDIAKNKNKAARDKRQTDNIVKRQVMVKSLLRAQRYLGLAPSEKQVGDLAGLSVTDDAKFQHPFDQDVIFIAVDVEAYERQQKIVTEIGVATLDTRDLKKSAPGAVGEDWQQFIRGRHFRIAEYKNYKNTEFVQGCPENFEFGNSEFISKDDIGSTLSSCFKQPFSAPESSDPEEKRNIILLGHDVSQDITYLQRAGFNVLNSGNLIATVDTVELFKVYKKDPNSRSLGGILYEFDLTGWHLHNAGNDAVYTVWAMLAICVKAADKGSTSERQQDTIEKRTEAAVEQAKQKVQDESEGWEAEGGDGGVPVASNHNSGNGGLGNDLYIVTPTGRYPIDF